MLDLRERFRVGGRLVPEAWVADFVEAHRRIWLGMCSLAEKSEPVDLVTLKNELAIM
jgi:replicative DNA helicase